MVDTVIKCNVVLEQSQGTAVTWTDDFDSKIPRDRVSKMGIHG
jgi:hypothetical protein